jgi:hypothetical protein
MENLIDAGRTVVPFNNETGYFTKPGENSGIRNFHSATPHSDAELFADRLTVGWKHENFEDGWKSTNGLVTVTYRSTTTTVPEFPAVDIRWNRGVGKLTSLKDQRVHFLGVTPHER